MSPTSEGDRCRAASPVEIMTPEEHRAVVALLERMRAKGITGDLWAIEIDDIEGNEP